MHNPQMEMHSGNTFADFVTTEDGTGIVHIAPSFGADDNLVVKKNGIGSLTLVDSRGVDLQKRWQNYRVSM